MPDCSTCYYSTPFTEQDKADHYLCRYHPPAPLARPMESAVSYETSRWPVVCVLDWCGQYRSSSDTDQGAQRISIVNVDNSIEMPIKIESIKGGIELPIVINSITNAVAIDNSSPFEIEVVTGSL